MAIHANGREYDISLIPGDQILTTTSQYLLVGMVAGTTTADRAVELCGQTNTVGTPTATSRHAIGINQSHLSSGSSVCDVRLFGVSKAICSASITAGEFLVAYEGASTTTRAGQIAPIADGASISAATASIAAHSVVIGRALEDGSTNTVISVFLNPQLYDQNLIS